MKTNWVRRKDTDDAPTWKPQWMVRHHRPRGFMQRDRMTGQTILRIRPQRGPAAGRTIVMWTNPQLLGEGIQATVDGHTQMAFGGCRSFFICHRAIINRLARDQRVNA